MNETTEIVLRAIQRERERQNDLVAAGKIRIDCACCFATSATQMPVLIEEVGEWAKSEHENESLERIYEEIIQVAAVAAAIAESYVKKMLATKPHHD